MNGYPKNTAQADRLPVFPHGIPELNRMEDARRRAEGNDCLECRSRIVNDQTPKYVFTNSSICHCFQGE